MRLTDTLQATDLSEKNHGAVSEQIKRKPVNAKLRAPMRKAPLKKNNAPTRTPTREPRLKISDDLIIAHTQPGFEGVAIREALTRFEGVREVGRRSIAARNGMALLSADHPEALARMRCAEDLFSVVGYVRPLGSGDDGLEQASKARAASAIC